MILAIIPARGGSKNIPKKNVRCMNGKPLVQYTLDKAVLLKKEFDVDVVVTTDDQEIMQIAKKYDVDLLVRPEELCGDDVPLAPVSYHALTSMEQNRNRRYDIVLTLQVTSPTLSITTLCGAIKYFMESDKDTILSVHNSPHLSWTVQGGEIIPNFEARVNRQMLPPHYEETGGFVITKRECVTEKNRIGKKVGVFEVPDHEAIDIDSKLDWVLCESILQSKRILFRVDGEEKLGMGHIYRCLSLAYHFTEHEVLFVLQKGMDLGIDKIKESFFPYELIANNDEMEKVIYKFNPDIVINDILNTDMDYMKKIHKPSIRVVNFEDIGEGASEADIVINALYEGKSVNQNEYRGSDYFFIRDEFIETQPKRFETQVKNIVIMFGGSDPSNYTYKLYKIAKDLHNEYTDIVFNFITGYGYAYKNDLKKMETENIFIHNDVERVSNYLQEADIAVTSQGRTIFEMASMGVPSVVLAQNRRELSHTFASLQNGYINLGIGDNVEDEVLYNTLKWLIETPGIRKEMRDAMLQYDFIKSQKTVVDLVLGR